MNAASKEPISVGVLLSETGVTSVIENSERMGTILAVSKRSMRLAASTAGNCVWFSAIRNRVRSAIRDSRRN